MHPHVHASSRACIRACTHLSQVCTHVLQIDKLKLKLYKGNLTYVAQNYVPDLLSYFELKATKFTMRFPTPGMLEGITSKLSLIHI